jgi:hypothetical protein
MEILVIEVLCGGGVEGDFFLGLFFFYADAAHFG